MGYKILLADDDRDLLEMLGRYFEMKGYQILQAGNGTEAVRMSAEEPDLILLDINMPGMDGLEVCRKIRGQVSCPILFLTARVEEQDRVNGLMLGGDDYIIKPFRSWKREYLPICGEKRDISRRHGTGLETDFW